MSLRPALSSIAQHRLRIFTAELDKTLANRARAWRAPFVVKLLNGDAKTITTPDLTPLDVAKDISKSLAKTCAIALVDGRPWDLTRPLFDAVADTQRDEVSLQLINISADEAKYVFAHSSAHGLGLALERVFGEHLKLADGPPISNGCNGEFFYEAVLPDNGTVQEADLDRLTKEAANIVQEALPFDRVAVSAATAREVFKHNPYKLEFIQKVPNETPIVLYRMGELVDLCTGPHLPHTGLVRAIQFHKVSGALEFQRVYGVAFPALAKMQEWQSRRQAALERDHRLIGEKQQLFMLHGHSPGSPFFMPHGMRIINKLKEMMQREYWTMGYHEVGTPSVYHKDLWKTSGHWDVYKDDMFLVRGGREADEELELGLKPMNCPGHCLMFAHGVYSYRDLPIRMADFGGLHRNEKSGALSGLTRVRKFHQDDAHIFCRQDQIESEVEDCLRMVERVYGRFGMPVHYALSTRPAEYIGDEEIWNKAESSLKECLRRTDRSFITHDGDGAFYGPKIDVTVTDALGREHQTATVQLDFQLPVRFKLKYMDDRGESATPVMIHRAMLGSLERMFALLCEHTGGKWPVWLSPRHAVVLPVSTTEPLVEYARHVAAQLHAQGFYVDADTRGESLKKKIRHAWGLQYNYMLVVGDEELGDGTVSVRTRGSADSVSMPLSDFAARLADETALR